MRRRILDFIVCPKCRGTFRAQSFGGPGPSAADDPEIVEGVLECIDCKSAFPIIEGVPRILHGDLLVPLTRRYPEYFSRHPTLAPKRTTGTTDLSETLESFTRQRLDLKPPSTKFAEQWRDNLQRNLGQTISLESLRSKIILDVGCGFGRHLYVANQFGAAETIGIDLSGGVDVAYANNKAYPQCHIVQTNLYERAVRDESVDIVWSFGVLHHLPDPRAGFLAVVPFVKRGGLVVIWVYGYRGLAFTYRLSHMRSLHRLTKRMSHPARVRASKFVAALLSAVYWEPLRSLKTLGLRDLVERLPLSSYVDHPWSARVAGVHDRLSTPITHFHDREELVEWFRGAQLEDILVQDTDRRGWRAHGRRPALAQ